MKALIRSTTWACNAEALVVYMSLLRWSMTFTFLRSFIINFLSCFNQLFDLIRIDLLSFLFISALVRKQLVFGLAIGCTPSNGTWLDQVLWSLKFWSSINWYLSCRTVRCWFNPTSCFRVVWIHFKTLVVIVVTWVSCMMNNGRVLTYKSSWVIETFESILCSICNSVPSCWLWFIIDMLQLRILRNQLLNCLRSIIYWWPLLIKTSLDEISLGMIKTWNLHSWVWVSWSNVLSVIEAISRSLRNYLIHANIEILSLLQSWMVLSLTLWCSTRHKLMPTCALCILIILVLVGSLLWLLC